MLRQIVEWDNRILRKLAAKHTPALNRVLVLVTRSGNNGYIWFALSIPLLLIMFRGLFSAHSTNFAFENGLLR